MEKRGQNLFKPSCVSPVGLQAPSWAKVLDTASYKEGLFEVQDEGSQLIALFALWPLEFASLLAPEPGSTASASLGADMPPALPRWSSNGLTVIDACAGAGGKCKSTASFFFFCSL